MTFPPLNRAFTRGRVHRHREGKQCFAPIAVRRTLQLQVFATPAAKPYTRLTQPAFPRLDRGRRRVDATQVFCGQLGTAFRASPAPRNSKVLASRRFSPRALRSGAGRSWTNISWSAPAAPPLLWR